ncbi:MAG: DUF1499 domain-containing protein [Deltaproteobacteria bacterium]|nr:DUF1499 domain-containing protein [Deltaproteobacteria bacterium]
MTASNVNSSPQLQQCPASPNCVSSQSADSHYIEPFKIAANCNAAFEAVRQILANRPDTVIKSATDEMIAVEFKTTLGFVDDGLFMLDSDNRLIHVRSAARLGYWDLGKNRRRLEEIRAMYNQSDDALP